MKKTELIQKLKILGGISHDERAYLINLVNTKKKYGLVWEEKPEDVEELLRENLPVLKEVKDRAIINGEEAQYTNDIDSLAYIPLLHPDRWIVYEGSRAGWISQIIFGSKYVNPIIQNRVATTIIKKNNTKHLQFIAIRNKTYHIIFKQSLVRHASDLSRDTTLIIMLFACGSLYLLRKEKKRQDDSLNISRDT